MTSEPQKIRVADSLGRDVEVTLRAEGGRVIMSNLPAIGAITFDPYEGARELIDAIHRASADAHRQVAP